MSLPKKELKITQCKWFLDKTTIEGPKQRYENKRGLITTQGLKAKQISGKKNANFSFLILYWIVLII